MHRTGQSVHACCRHGRWPYCAPSRHRISGPPVRRVFTLFTWLKTQGIDNALIQPYSDHATRQSLEIYSRLALADAQQRYDDVIGDFPI